jgi:anti-sigma factor RsiW
MYSFRFPKVALPIPPNFTQIVLNEAAVERKKKPSEMRFGGEKPEAFGIRGSPALLFEKDGQTTVYWQEEGVGHTVTSRLPRKELFNVIEDLL